MIRGAYFLEKSFAPKIVGMFALSAKFVLRFYLLNLRKFKISGKKYQNDNLNQLFFLVQSIKNLIVEKIYPSKGSISFYKKFFHKKFFSLLRYFQCG